MTGWVEHAVWWQVYPLGFTGAPPQSDDGAVVRRLGRLEAWLDYAAGLGVSGLALGPVFASHTHGYDTIDHFRIDPRLGDEDDFARLARAAHERGLRVLLDGVFNHVGRGFPAFAAVLKRGPAAPTASWFRLSWPDGAQVGTEPDYQAFEGHRQLVALNHDEPAVADYVAAVMTHWLQRGADGWRLDAAYAVPPAFWAKVLPRVRAARPDAYIVGEAIHGDYAAIVRESGMDSVTQYELWKATWSSLNDTNFFELAWALDRHNGFTAAFAPLTFAGNHDVTRLASRLCNTRHLPHALAILLTAGGTPSIYYGDEQAFRGIKEDRPGGDDAIRPAFPATPAHLAPYGWDTYRLHQHLIGLRRRNPWLHHARTSIVHLANGQLAYEAHHDGHRLITTLNVADTPARLPAPHARTVQAGTGQLDRAGTADAAIALGPHGWAILTPLPPLPRTGAVAAVKSQPRPVVMACRGQESAEHGPGEVAAGDDGVLVVVSLEQRDPGLGALSRVDVEQEMPARLADLRLGVHDVAEDEQSLIAGRVGDQQAGVPWGMARGGNGLHAGHDGLAAVQELDDAAERFLDRVLVRAGQFGGPVPVVPFGSVGDVASAGKGQAADRLGALGVRGGRDVAGPADVVVVQVGEHDGVDVGRAQAFAGQAVQQRAASERGHSRDLEIDLAQPEVDQDPVRAGADEEGSDADWQPAVAVEVGGVDGPTVRPGGREQHGRVQMHLTVGQVGDGGGTKGDLASRRWVKHDVSCHQRALPLTFG